MCVTVVRVDRALREPCLPEGELSPILHAESGLRNREAPSQPYRSIAIQTPEGTVTLHATAPHLGAIFSPEHFGPYLEDTGRTRERERERRSQGHLVFTFTADCNTETKWSFACILQLAHSWWMVLQRTRAYAIHSLLSLSAFSKRAYKMSRVLQQSWLNLPVVTEENCWWLRCTHSTTVTTSMTLLVILITALWLLNLYTHAIELSTWYLADQLLRP